MKNKMIKISVVIFICLFSSSGYSFGETENDKKYEIAPTIVDASTDKVYVPSDIDGCFKELKKMLHPKFIEEMKSGTEQDMIKYHRGLGMWLRNNWGLWSGSHLKEYFNNIGIFHPDDMSSIILNSFWRHINSKPIRLEEQVQYYVDYWKEQK